MLFTPAVRAIIAHVCVNYKESDMEARDVVAPVGPLDQERPVRRAHQRDVGRQRGRNEAIPILEQLLRSGQDVEGGSLHGFDANNPMAGREIGRAHV